MTPRYVLASQLFQLKKHEQFCKKSLLGLKKVARDNNNGTWGMWVNEGASTKIKNSCENFVCFKSCPIPGDFGI